MRPAFPACLASALLALAHVPEAARSFLLLSPSSASRKSRGAPGRTPSRPPSALSPNSLGRTAVGSDTMEVGGSGADGGASGGAAERVVALPPRAQVPTHAVFGSLLRPGCVESFEVREVAAAAPPAASAVPIVAATVQLGRDLDGHPGVVHGGVLALLIDDVLGFACEAVLRGDDGAAAVNGDPDGAAAAIPAAVTANLSVDYRQPVPSGSCIRITVWLRERADRKLVWEARVTAPPPPGEGGTGEGGDGTAVVFCEASSVFVIPRGAGSTPKTNGT